MGPIDWGGTPEQIRAGSDLQPIQVDPLQIGAIPTAADYAQDVYAWLWWWRNRDHTSSQPAAAQAYPAGPGAHPLSVVGSIAAFIGSAQVFALLAILVTYNGHPSRLALAALLGSVAALVVILVTAQLRLRLQPLQVRQERDVRRWLQSNLSFDNLERDRGDLAKQTRTRPELVGFIYYMRAHGWGMNISGLYRKKGRDGPLAGHLEGLAVDVSQLYLGAGQPQWAHVGDARWLPMFRSFVSDAMTYPGLKGVLTNDLLLQRDPQLQSVAHARGIPLHVDPETPNPGPCIHFRVLATGEQRNVLP